MIKLDKLDNIFLTSDSHFGHENIIKYTNRPYNTIKEMDLDLIYKWNSATNEDSIIFHHGDFTLGDWETAQNYFSQLNGTIYILALDWHHDKRWLKNTQIGGTSLNGKIHYLPPIEVLELPIKTEAGYSRKITMSHYPLQSWEGSFYEQWHTYGHIHSKAKDRGLVNSIDVGVDKWNGRLVRLGDLVRWLTFFKR